MQIILTREDLASLSEAARDEILIRLLGKKSQPEPAALPHDPRYVGIDLVDVAHLNFPQIKAWMEAASDKTKAGLLIFATQGPVVRAKDLVAGGIHNLAHFQSRTTIRTRTVTGKRDSYLLGWDDWSRVEDGEGRYAVTPETYRSLRRYFQLP